MSKDKLLFLSGIITTALLVAVLALGYHSYVLKKKIADTRQNIGSTQQDAQLGAGQPIPSDQPSQPDYGGQYQEPELFHPPVIKGTDAFGSYVTASNEYVPGVIIHDYTENFTGTNKIVVQWRKDHPVLSETAVKSLVDPISAGFLDEPGCLELRMRKEDCPGGKMREAGKITSPASLRGVTLYYIEAPILADGIGDSGLYLAFYTPKLNKFIYINEGVTKAIAPRVDTFFAGFISQGFPELQALDEMVIPNDVSVLKRSQQSPFSGGGLYDLFYNSAPTSTELLFTHPQYGPVIFNKFAYSIALPNGERVSYDVFPYFLKKTTPEEAQKQMYSSAYTALITWTDGRDLNKETSYIPSIEGRGGCGSSMFPRANNVNDELWFDERNLISTGKTQRGELVYELKDAATNQIYNDLFEIGYRGSLAVYGSSVSGYLFNGKLLTYGEVTELPREELFPIFLSEHPIFFWKDAYGHWHMFQRDKYQSMAECGKPVIYLYPQKTTDVHVQVAPTKGLTITDPDYGKNGWFVRATPDSQIYNYANGKTYPYLFWEGHSDGPARPDAGFVWKREDVPVKMRQTLARTGLNKKETEDFMEFWQDKLMVRPYVFVTFFPQHQFNLMAPMKVSPRPDSVIRVFMDYESLDAPKLVPPLELKTPIRKGFTVVEWGGVLHK